MCSTDLGILMMMSIEMRSFTHTHPLITHIETFQPCHSSTQLCYFAGPLWLCPRLQARSLRSCNVGAKPAVHEKKDDLPRSRFTLDGSWWRSMPMGSSQSGCTGWRLSGCLSCEISRRKRQNAEQSSHPFVGYSEVSIGSSQEKLKGVRLEVPLIFDAVPLPTFARVLWTARTCQWTWLSVLYLWPGGRSVWQFTLSSFTSWGTSAERACKTPAWWKSQSLKWKISWKAQQVFEIYLLHTRYIYTIRTIRVYLLDECQFQVTLLASSRSRRCVKLSLLWVYDCLCPKA